MTRRWSQIRRLFNDAVDVPTPVREPMLRQAAEQNPSVVEAVRGLIVADNQVEPSFLHPMAPNIGLTKRKGIFHSEEVIGSRYLIELQIGSGGMGEVYRALDLELQSRVALKVVRSEQLFGGGAAERLRRELQITRRINHPNVCRVFDVGRHVDGNQDIVFFTMELLDGESLNERLRRLGPYSVEEAFSIALQMAQGLAAAHKLGVVHRDFKPGNVMLVREADGKQRAVILDFGIARFVDNTLSGSLTMTGQALGTPAYMAPEQFQSEATTASDVYSFGVVLHEMTAIGRGETAPWFSKRREWEVVAQRCIQRDPTLRYGNAGELVEALRADAGARKRRLWIWLSLLLAISSGFLVLYKNRSVAISLETRRWMSAGADDMTAGMYWSASRNFARAAEADNNYPAAWTSLAHARIEMEDWDRAQEAIVRTNLKVTEQSMEATGRIYQDAVQLTAVRDFKHAAERFRQRAEKAKGSTAALAWVDAARANTRAGDLDASVRLLEHAIQLQPVLPLAFLRMGVIYAQRGQFEKALTSFAKAENAFRSAGQAEAVVEVLLKRSQMYSARRMLKESEDETRRALVIAEASGNPHQRARSKLQLAILFWQMGATEQSLSEVKEASGLAREAGLQHLVARSYLDLGSAQYIRGSYAEARESFTAALQTSRAMKSRVLEGQSLMSLASLQIRLGELPSGIENATEALRHLEANGMRREAAASRVLLGRAKRDLGDYQSAEAIFRDQLAIASQGESLQETQLARESLGSVLMRLERYPEALPLYRRNYEEQSNSTAKVMSAYASLNYGGVLWRLGEYAPAIQLLKQAKNSGYALLPQVLLEEAQMALSQRRFELARRLAVKAAGRFSRDATNSIAQAQTIECAALLSRLPVAATIQRCVHSLNGAASLAEDILAQRRLWAATGHLAGHQTKEAQTVAKALLTHYGGLGQQDSLWRVQLLVARIADASGDRASAREAAREGSNTSINLQERWPRYSSRPDVRDGLQQLQYLRQ